MTPTKLTPYENMIFKTRYARWNDKTGARETFKQANDRYLKYFREHLLDRQGYEVPLSLEKELRKSLNARAVTGSMRTLSLAGDALRSAEMGNFNCTALPLDSVRGFSEIAYILATGAGVGFSVERRFIEKLPYVPAEFEPAERPIVVSDSREGWSKAIAKVMGSLYDGKIPTWDTSKVRKKGARLMTFGGFSSGPEVLEELFEHIIKIFTAAKGRRLASTDCFSIATYTAQIIVAGATRRSATICLFDADDAAMRHAKGPMSNMYSQDASGKWMPGPNAHFAMANISAVYEKKPNIMEFMALWEDLVESNAGEPGIFNRQAVWAKMKKNGRSVVDENGVLYDMLTNPCQRGNAPLMTPNGIVQIKDIKIGDKVWDGEGYTRVIAHKMTGVKPVYRYETTAGVFEGTEQHRILQNGEKIEVQYADSIDSVAGPTGHIQHEPVSVMDGLILGDGGQHQGTVLLYIGDKDGDYHTSEVAEMLGKKYKGLKAYRGMTTTLKAEDLPTMLRRTIPDRLMYNRSNSEVCSLLRGLLSSNGSVCGKRITYKTVSKQIARQIQTLLSSVGIASYITTNKPAEVRHKNGLYTGKKSYDLNIGTKEGRRVFAATIGFLQAYKNKNLKQAADSVTRKSHSKKTYDVVRKTYLGEEPVYDITVEDAKHVYWSGGLLVSNCAEILLRPAQACNLSTVIIRENDTLETLMRKVELATILGTWQSTVSNFKYLRKSWKKTIDEDRLLGVCLTGFYDHPVLAYPSDETKKWLKQLKEHAVKINEVHAKKLGIPKSAAVTAVKPAGNTSQLCNVASGIHPRRSKFMIRTVRQADGHPITQFLKDQGVPWEVSVQNSDDIVFSFPIKAPDSAVLVSDISALQQLEHWKAVNDSWAQHTVSCTINIKNDVEWLQTGSWVLENWDSVTGLSFLPTSDTIYSQAPEQPCEQEEYESALKALPDIDWEKLKDYEQEDLTTSSHEMACVGGACEL